MRLRRLADLESVQTLRLRLGHLDVLDVRMAGPAADELDHPLERVLVALEDRLDGAVATVADPTGDTRAACFTLRRVPEEHTLHATTRDYPAPDHDASAVSARNSYAMFAASSAVT